MLLHVVKSAGPVNSHLHGGANLNRGRRTMGHAPITSMVDIADGDIVQGTKIGGLPTTLGKENGLIALHFVELAEFLVVLFEAAFDRGRH